MEDILSSIGTFLSNKDIFIISSVNKEWNKSQFHNKKQIFKKAKKDIYICHICDNCCPCLLERYYQNLIEDFKLKKYMCSLLNGENIPEWISLYLE